MVMAAYVDIYNYLPTLSTDAKNSLLSKVQNK